VKLSRGRILELVTADQWDALLVAATAVHAGFQLTVTWLVYPALEDLAASSWTSSHATRSRRIVRFL